MNRQSPSASTMARVTAAGRPRAPACSDSIRPQAPRFMARAPCRFTTSPRRVARVARLQLWLAEGSWGRVLLWLWAFVFRGAKWPNARAGMWRGLRALWRELVTRLRKKK